ncbi:hypothetical protein [Roseibium album]|uniref:hypothetical protein n=1 Tax=Roseibium album TaxID=311410 RepID=UPI003BB0BE1B
MKTFPLHSVDCQLLYRDHEPLQGSELEELVRQSAEMLGLHPDGSQLISMSADHDIQMMCGNLKVLVTQSLPLEEKAHLKEAARFQIAQDAIRQGLELTDNCRAVTSISVRKGMLADVEFPEGMARLHGPEIQSFANAKETVTAMNLAKVISVNLLRKTPALAVFWAPNQHFLPPQTFSELAISDEPTMLYIRPHIYSPIQEVSEKRLIGVSAAGSEYILGFKVGFEPSRLPVQFMVQNLMVFASFCLQRGSVLPDGDVFGKSEKEKIRLDYQETSEGEPDKIVLAVQSSAELGIVGEERPTIYHAYNEDGERLSSTVTDVDVSDLDPDDPVDAAILERLAELKKATPPPENRKTASDTAPPKEPVETPSASPVDEMQPITPPRHSTDPAPRRASMEELRSLARQHQVSREETAERKGRKGLFGKIFGKKSGE